MPQRRPTRASLAALVLLFAALVFAPLPGRAALPAPDLAAIDAYVEAERQADKIPGVALAIVRGDRIVHRRGYGVAGPDGPPITPQTPFLLGSLSKSFTALAVMQLVEQGKIELDAPAQRYLPWFRVADEDASARITVRDLLVHRSGIPTSAYLPMDNSSLENRLQRLRSVEVQPIGTVQYSSPNYQGLGAIIQAVSGEPFDDYIKKHIFSPLDMTRSYTSAAEAAKNGLAQGHLFFFGIQVADGTPLFDPGGTPNGYLISCAEDMAHHLIANIEGGRYQGASVLSAAGIAELHRPVANEGSYSYGMGWRVGTTNGLPSISHGGALPGFRTAMVILPESRYGVVVLTNLGSHFAEHAGHRIAGGVASLLAGMTPPPSRGRPIEQVYLVIDLVLAVILALQVRSFVILRKWRDELARRLRGGSAGEAAREGPSGRLLIRYLVMPIASDILWGFVILFGVPRFVGASLSAILVSQPDIGWAMVVLGAASFARGGARAALGVSALRGREAPKPEPAEP